MLACSELHTAHEGVDCTSVTWPVNHTMWTGELHDMSGESSPTDAPQNMKKQQKMS